MKKVLSVILLFSIIFATVPASAQASDNPFTYENLNSLVRKVNDYYISSHTHTPGYEWDTATYYIGCMDAYFLTGNEKYRSYATAWANQNAWQGHPGTDKSVWSNSNVFHADNETCFQVYLDLYNLDVKKDENKIARVKEITSAQLATGRYDFWTWCDAIHMAMPVYSELYSMTGDEKYLDFMYKSFMWSKSKMYDGDGGINYADTKTNLFFRDPSYISSRVNGEKNIWARGVGWVMAAFARVFDDIPENWEHYDEFKTTYLEMAQACIDCARTDSEGRVFWTQSMLSGYPTSDQNPYGYETSGTGFITYSLYYGINSGLLDKSTYLPYAEGALKYLTEKAIRSDGYVGYVQHIGSAATKATTANDSYNFGVGAVLYALCEACRFYGGVQGDMYPYLTHQTVGTVSFKIGSNYVFNGTSVFQIDSPPFINADGTAMVPLRAVAEAFNSKFVWNDDLKSVTLLNGDSIIQFVIGSNNYYVDFDRFTAASAPVIENGRTYLPLRALTDAFGKNIYLDDEKQLIVIGSRQNPFYPCHAALVTMLDNILRSGALPERDENNIREYTSFLPDFGDENKIAIVSAVASQTPEIQNPAENAFDSNLSTRWAADGEAEIIFDLGSVLYVDHVAAMFWKYAERSVNYEVLVSTDGASYTSRFIGEAPRGVEAHYTSVKDNVRYIKLICHGTSAGSWTSLLELVPYSK